MFALLISCTFLATLWGCVWIAQGKVPYDLANRPGNEDAMRLLIAACIDWQLALRTPSTKGSC